jgi:hypothetical protein
VRRLADGSVAVANGGSNQIRVFSGATDGTWRADVTLPPRFMPLDFGRECVAGVAFDDDDVERVVVWGLLRQAPR